MIKTNIIPDIKGLSVLTSSICNLDCSFCFLNKNKAFKNYDAIIKQSWQDFSYLNNVEKSLKKLKINFNNVRSISYWGGETLIYINDITKNIPKLFKLFPNIDEIRFSTNWTIDEMKLFEHLKEIDKNANNLVKIHMQCSIDGPYEFTENGHHISFDIYEKKFINFLNHVNQYKFNKIKINMITNSTLSKETFLNKLDTEEKIYQYIKGMDDLNVLLKSHCISRYVDVTETITFPKPAYPYTTTSQEGLIFTNINSLWQKVKIKHFPNLSLNFILAHGSNIGGENKNYFSPNYECCELIHHYTMLPDGGITHCSGTYLYHYLDYQKELLSNNQQAEFLTTKIESKLAFNPLIMADDELEDQLYFLSILGNTNITYIYYTFNLAKKLARIGQIDSKYLENNELLLKHVLIFLRGFTCPRENIAQTKIFYCCSPSTIRHYFNGTMDLIEHNDLQKIKKKELLENVDFKKLG